jgi:hypothetical protein
VATPVATPDPIAEPPIEPHAVELLEVPEPESPPPVSPGGHTGYAVDGCDCWLCETHRTAEREEAATRALELRDDQLVEGSVRFAANATDELRDGLNGRHP